MKEMRKPRMADIDETIDLDLADEITLSIPENKLLLKKPKMNILSRQIM